MLVQPPHPATLDEESLYAQCDMGKSRSSGPGGQHRNKVETMVILTHRPTGIVAQASERRSAEENRRVAMFRLRLALAMHARCVPEPRNAWGDTRSDLWKTRCAGGRVACNPEHRDYPSLLAEALDMVACCDLDPKKAAMRLDITASQLIKLVKDCPHALEQWNRRRVEQSLHALR